MLCMHRARIDLLGVRQKEKFQQLSEATKHETDHIPEALREFLWYQFRQATDDRSEKKRTLHVGTESTLTRQNK